MKITTNFRPELNGFALVEITTEGSVTEISDEDWLGTDIAAEVERACPVLDGYARRFRSFSRRTVPERVVLFRLEDLEIPQ